MSRRRHPTRWQERQLEAAFAVEVQRLSAEDRRPLLAWLRSWRGSMRWRALRAWLDRRSGRYRPERMFWEITPTGERRRL